MKGIPPRLASVVLIDCGHVKLEFKKNCGEIYPDYEFLPHTGSINIIAPMSGHKIQYGGVNVACIDSNP